VTGLRSEKEKTVQQWWTEAKRHAFRTWPYLINSPTGIFLVTKAVKTPRYAHCFSKGTPGQFSQIRIMSESPPSSATSALAAAGTKWVAVQNDLRFELEDSAEKSPYTIFIERASTRMFLLTDSNLMSEATKLWR
jgi:hypothetical protein